MDYREKARYYDRIADVIILLISWKEEFVAQPDICIKIEELLIELNKIK